MWNGWEGPSVFHHGGRGHSDRQPQTNCCCGCCCTPETIGECRNSGLEMRQCKKKKKELNTLNGENCCRKPCFQHSNKVALGKNGEDVSSWLWNNVNRKKSRIALKASKVKISISWWFPFFSVLQFTLDDIVNKLLESTKHFTIYDFFFLNNFDTALTLFAQKRPRERRCLTDRVA